MKTRNGFVSNSSSSSFVVTEEKHGKWFCQLIRMMTTINEGMVNFYTVLFDKSTTKTTELTWLFRILQDQYPNVDRPELQIFVCGDKVGFRSNIVSLLKPLRTGLINKIKSIDCMFHDECDIGNYADGFHDKLKKLQLPFDWNR